MENVLDIYREHKYTVLKVYNIETARMRYMHAETAATQDADSARDTGNA